MEGARGEPKQGAWFLEAEGWGTEKSVLPTGQMRRRWITDRHRIQELDGPSPGECHRWNGDPSKIQSLVPVNMTSFAEGTFQMELRKRS